MLLPVLDYRRDIQLYAQKEETREAVSEKLHSYKFQIFPLEL